MRTIAAVLLAFSIPLAGASVDASPPIASDYGVFCVRGRLTLDQRRIEELKTAHGDDVCRLDQDGTEAGARAKVDRLGGVGAVCTCP